MTQAKRGKKKKLTQNNNSKVECKVLLNKYYWNVNEKKSKDWIENCLK